jgi:hypothetical protein
VQPPELPPPPPPSWTPPPPPPRLPAEPTTALGAEPLVEYVEATEKQDKFRTIVALLIAVVSILGAIVAFRASLSEQEAHQLDLTSLQEAEKVEQILNDADATANDDMLHAAQYQEHVKASAKLKAEADAATTAGNTDLATTLTAASEHETVLARTVYRFMSGYSGAGFTATNATDKPITFDRQAEVNFYLENNSDYTKLNPEATQAHAEKIHDRAVYMLGVVTLFIASLLFLTLAQFTRRSIRPLFAGAGAAFSAAGVALWVVVERIT